MGNVPCSTKSSHCPSGQKTKINYSDNDMKHNAKFVNGVGFIPANAKSNKHRSFRIKKKWFNRYSQSICAVLHSFTETCYPTHLCEVVLHKLGGGDSIVMGKTTRKTRKPFKMPTFPKLTTTMI